MLYKEAITNTIIIVTVMPLFYLLLIHLPGNRYSMNLNHFHVSQNVIHSFGRAVTQIKKCNMSSQWFKFEIILDGPILRPGSPD